MALAGCLVLAAAGAVAQTPGPLVVRAWATLAANVGPQMEVRINGAVVGSTEVRATGYQNHTFPSVSIPAGAKLELVFNNDAFSGDGDPNLFVESITVNGSTIASNAPGVVFTGSVRFPDGSSCTSICSRTFNNGSAVTLTATPASGFTFTGWSGACSGNPPTSAAHLKPLAGSYAIGRGTELTVWSDYFGVRINPGARDLGAVKR
jgi:hypothetical protein